MTLEQKRSFRPLDIVPSCNFVQYQEKRMMQTSENVKNLNYEPNFGPQFFFFCEFYLYWLDIVGYFRPNFGPFSPDLITPMFFLGLSLLVVKNCPKLTFYAISRKNKTNCRKWKKT